MLGNAFSIASLLFRSGTHEMDKFSQLEVLIKAQSNQLDLLPLPHQLLRMRS